MRENLCDFGVKQDFRYNAKSMVCEDIQVLIFRFILQTFLSVRIRESSVRASQQ